MVLSIMPQAHLWAGPARPGPGAGQVLGGLAATADCRRGGGWHRRSGSMAGRVAFAAGAVPAILLQGRLAAGDRGGRAVAVAVAVPVPVAVAIGRQRHALGDDPVQGPPDPAQHAPG